MARVGMIVVGLLSIVPRFGAAQTPAPRDSHVVAGIVRMEPTLRVVEGAVIEVVSPATLKRTVLSDSSGRYRLLVTGEGQYELRARLVGAYEERRRIRIWPPHYCQPGRCSTIDTLNFYLRKATLPPP